MIKLEIDARDLDEVRQMLLLYPHQANSALRRTINKTLSWAASRGMRAIAQENDIPLKVLRNRRRGKVRKALLGNLTGVAWFGTAPIKAIHLGQARQTRAGARAGSRLFPGAFIAQVRSGIGSVYARLGEASPDGVSGGHIGIFRRRGASRLPIDEEYVRLTAARQALDGIAAQIPERLSTVFAQEMNYELNVRGKT